MDAWSAQLFRSFPLDRMKDMGYITLQQRELDLGHSTAWMQDDIHRQLKRADFSTNSLSHSSLNPIALHRIAHGTTHRQSDACACIRLAQCTVFT